MRKQWFVLSVLGAFGAAIGCTPQGDPGLPASGFKDDFNRAQLGELWHKTGGNYQIREGQLYVHGARNKPLWLRRALPDDVRVELDARSESPGGDIKVELFGDGVSRARAESYVASGYVIIFGGWNNAVNAIARLDEHGSDRVVGKNRRVEPGRTYRIKIERVDDTLTVWVDDEVLVKMEDPRPLSGRGHDHFAFNNWESELWFDNLEITPL